MWLFGKKKKREDGELLADYRTTGNPSVFGELFEKHIRDVYAVCFFYFRDKQTAEDAAMQVFEKLMSDLRKHEVKHFRAWLSYVVRNHCISELRKKKGKHFLPETYLDFEINIPDAQEEEKINAVKEDEMLNNMRVFLPLLKEKHRVCLELFYLRGLSYQTVSEQTGYGVNEVRSYIQNGKRNLKLMLSEKLNTDHNETRP